MPQKFTNVTPISGAQTFTNVTPIGGGPDPNNPAAGIPNPAAHDNPNNPIARNPTYHDYETIGSSEGAGLAEGLSDWDKASFGEVGGGVADVARGNIARGLHRTISGGMTAAVPALPFVAAAAPAAMARGVIAGGMAGAGVHKGAEILGATPDQADLAGDIGGLAGGGIGAKASRGAVSEAMATRTGQSVGVLAKSAGKLPIVDKFVDAGKTLGELGDIWRKPKPTYPGAPLPEDPGTFPGAPLPEAPAPEVTQASALFYGPQQTVDSAAGLGKVPVRSGSIAESMPAPTNAEPSPIATTPAAQQSAAPPPAPAVPTPSPRPIARGTLNKMMDQELGKALGAKQLDPKVPLRGQMAAKMPTESEAAIPEGHKAVESSALRSYRYDPAAREFHARATSGNTVYVYGDVSPEEAAAFEAAESKGKAWQGIRRSPLVAKIVDGKRVAVKTGATSSP